MHPLLLLLSLSYPFYGGYTPVQQVSSFHHDILDRAFPIVRNLMNLGGNNILVEKDIEEVAQKVVNGNNLAFRLKGGVCFETYEAFNGSDFAIINVMRCKTVRDLISR